MGTFRKKLVYGDVTNEDAKLFSKLMGTKTIYEAREGDQEINMVTAETKTKSIRRTSYSYSKKEVPILSENDILIQKAFPCPAKIQVDSEAAAYWLKRH
ncbi:hypothetical protein IEQ_04937 [Bacillus cereus BAG6X1-2]|nr:hypothetical protein IEQ_04937 [Bacillus cereus BAG6X1-2]